MDHGLMHLVQICSLILTLLVSFMVICPLAVTLKAFAGHCPLGTKLLEIPTSERQVNILSWGITSTCVYPEFMGFVALFFSIGYIIWLSFLISQSAESSWRDSFLGSCLSSVLTLMILVSSSVLSQGLTALCNQLSSHGTSCENKNVDGYKWFDGAGNATAPYDATSFYTYFQMAEVCSWLMLCLFISQMIIFGIKLYQNSRSHGFMMNLERERETILNRNRQRRYDQI